MPLPLEDNFNDIIGKTMRGLNMTDGEIAEVSGISKTDINKLVSGEWDESVARYIAPLLGLNSDALAASGNRGWAPAPISLDGLAQFTTPFEDMTVNSYLIWDPASREAAAFDTGADATEMLEFLAAENLTLKYILLTHTHGDHIFDLDRLRSKTGAPAFVGDREPLEGAESFAVGRRFSLGALHIGTVLTWGHSQGGITYLVSGLAHPVAVVGDAIFAGSMGGGGVSYADALRTNREEIVPLPDETIVCPGHGPMTTIGEEKAHNPFLA